VFTNLIDYGMDVQEAIERPRFLIGAFLPDDPADAVHVESRVGARVLQALARKGDPIKVGPEFLNRTGHAHGIAFVDGTLTGRADLRGDGVARGF
jgi:gamma-glutamyltranspeptidase